MDNENGMRGEFAKKPVTFLPIHNSYNREIRTEVGNTYMTFKDRKVIIKIKEDIEEFRSLENYEELNKDTTVESLQEEDRQVVEDEANELATTPYSKSELEGMKRNKLVEILVKGLKFQRDELKGKKVSVLVDKILEIQKQ